MAAKQDPGERPQLLAALLFRLLIAAAPCDHDTAHQRRKQHQLLFLLLNKQ